MGKIYTGIELGTDSVKIVVAEKLRNKYNILAATSYHSNGIKNGQIVDIKSSVESIKSALAQTEEMLGVQIKKVIAAVPPTDCRMDILVGSVEVANPQKIVGTDISNVLNEAISGHKLNDYEIITATPISFVVDDVENIKDPKGMSGKILEAKIVIGSIPKENLYKILQVINLSEVETVDVAFTSTGDYFAISNYETDASVGAIINIVESSTNVSIFNKGIQIKHSILPFGSANVDKDLAYVYDISLSDARKIKENFAFAINTYADEEESIHVICTDNSHKEITQVGVSKVVESRLNEILKLSKNEIKNLTNREIRYIIITGGLSELQGFNYLVDTEFSGQAKVCKISTIGIRHNKYSSAFGVIKYFDDKLSLRGRSYNMIDKETLEILTSTENSLNSDNIITKIFGHLYD